MSMLIALAAFVALSAALNWWPLALLAITTLIAASRTGRHHLRGHDAGPVGRAQAPGLHALVEELAARAGIATPEVWLDESRAGNAWALTDRHGGVVCVTRGALELLEPDELRAVLAHEVGHLRHRDSAFLVWFDAVRSALQVLSWLIGIFFAICVVMLSRRGGGDVGALLAAAVGALGAGVAKLLMAAGARSREFGADQFAADVTGDPLALVRALTRLEEESTPYLRLTSSTTSLAGRCIVSPFRGASSFFASSHPSTRRRTARLRRRLTAEQLAAAEQAANREALRRRQEAADRRLQFARYAEPHAGPVPASPKRGELIWGEFPCELVEMRSRRGVLVPVVVGPGRVCVTTERLIFHSSTRRHEWAWSRLVSQGWERSGSVHLFMAMVSNRQKASGFAVARASYEEAFSLVALARAVAAGDREGLVRSLQR